MEKDSFRIPGSRRMRIIIVRHGQTDTTEYINNDPDYPKADPPLSKIGKLQAYYTAQAIQALGFSGRVYSSPFNRTLETARETAALLKLPVYPAAPFREIVMSPENMRAFDGPSLSELRSRFPMIAPDAVLPDVWWSCARENSEDVKARVIPFIDRLIAGNTDVLLFGHGASTGAAVEYLLGKSGFRFNDFMTAPENSNCSLSIFDICEDRIVPVRIYGRDHLPALLMASNIRYALNPERKWYPYGTSGSGMLLQVRSESGEPGALRENFEKGHFIESLPPRFNGTVSFRINDRFIGDSYNPGPMQRTTARIELSGLTEPVRVRLVKAGNADFETLIEKESFDIRLPLYRGEIADCPVHVELLSSDGTLLMRTNPVFLSE